MTVIGEHVGVQISTLEKEVSQACNRLLDKRLATLEMNTRTIDDTKLNAVDREVRQLKMKMPLIEEQLSLFRKLLVTSD